MKKTLFIPLLVLLFTWANHAAGQDKDSAGRNNPLIVSGDLLRDGTTLYDSGAYRKAIVEYEKIDGNDTNYVRALYGIALCYYADSQFNKSIAYCQKALALDSDPEKTPDIYNHYGNSVDGAGDPVRALHIFDSAIALYPAYSLLYLNKGSVLLKQRRYGEAEAVFQQALLIDPWSYSSHYKLALCAINEGKLIPAFLSLMGYLVMNPEARYHAACIKLLNAMSRNTDEIQGLMNDRKETPSEGYQALEQIVQSKIALDKNYKPLIQLDDPISRQIQAILEKITYQESDSDFYMQYYVPFLKTCYDNQFELFINHLFFTVDLPVLKEYRQKNKKELTAFNEDAGKYFRLIRSTRELSYPKRDTATMIWNFSGGELTGHGKYLKKGNIIVGPWEFYYAAGNIRARGMYDDQGKRQGARTYYYSDGTVKGREFYRDGQQTDEETYYFSSGSRSTHSWYKDNQPDGESIAYYLVGSVHTVTHYRAGKEDGPKLTCYGNGDSSVLENYTAGVLNGPAETWYTNKQRNVLLQYKNGKEDGLYQKYYENGRLATEGNYVMGKQEGTWKFYFPNGQLKDEQNFVNDKQEGVHKLYYDNGVLNESNTYKHGKIDGEDRYYDEDGKIYAIYTYEKDLLEKAQFNDKAGGIIGQSDRDHKNIDLVQYVADGSKKMQAIFDAKDNISGTETFFYPSGKVMETDEYENGQEQGPSIVYYPDGTKKSETNYIDGKLNGYHRLWYSNGQVQEEGWYKDGDVCGYWLSYNDLGEVTDSVYYNQGTETGTKGSFLPNGRKEYEIKTRWGWIQAWKQFDSTGRVLQDLHFTDGTGRFVLVYPNGKRYIEGQYRQGKLDGPYTFYFPDDRKMIEESYVKGVLDGSYKSWSHNGVLRTEGHYSYGDKSGLWKQFYSNGKVKSEETYVDGKQNGKETDYTDDGKIETELEYKDDQKTGLFKKFDPDGTLVYQLMYKDNRPISYSWLDKDGHLQPETPILKQSGKIKTWFPNGKVSAEFEYRDGFLDGVSRLYFTNGQLRNQHVYKYGLLYDHYTLYFENGQLKADYIYLHDNLHGPYKEYNEKGVLIESGGYYDGDAHGTVQIFDDKGNPKETYLYYYGKMLSVK